MYHEVLPEVVLFLAEAAVRGIVVLPKNHPIVHPTLANPPLAMQNTVRSEIARN